MARLFVNAGVRAGARLHAEPDWAALVRELKRPGVNLLVLWDEYRAIHPEGYAYSRFCQLFREFERRLSPTMHQQHVAGHKAFVDYSGKRVPIIDPATGEVRTAEIFIVLNVVQTLGFTSVAFGLYVGLAMATSLLVYVPFARLADARGREPWVTLTYVFFALFPLSLVFARNAFVLAIAFVLMGLREIGEPPRKAMIVDLAREDRRSIDVGSYYLVRGLAVFPASLLGGFLWKIAPQYTFISASLIAGAGALVFYFAVARTT